MMATQPKRKYATAVAVVVEIYCPVCDRDDPIPAKDGSFMWDHLPSTVTCPDCGETSRVKATVVAR